mgnify:CR=1 FL=1
MFCELKNICFHIILYKCDNVLDRYLAIVGALAAEADYVFCPESPPPVDWPDKLCKKLEQARCLGYYKFTCYSVVSP